MFGLLAKLYRKLKAKFDEAVREEMIEVRERMKYDEEYREKILNALYPPPKKKYIMDYNTRLRYTSVLMNMYPENYGLKKE